MFYLIPLYVIIKLSVTNIVEYSKYNEYQYIFSYVLFVIFYYDSRKFVVLSVNMLMTAIAVSVNCPYSWTMISIPRPQL